MGKCPNGYSIDRIDNNGNYEPDNCRWVSSYIQTRNTSYNHLITFIGITMPMVSWSEFLLIPYKTLLKRIKRGWPIERAFELI